jgi:hypothetical protein
VEALAQRSVCVVPDSDSATATGFAGRLIGKIEFWVRNGKRFNFMILLASGADVVIAWTIGLQHCLVLWACFVVYGAAAIVLLIAILSSGMRGYRLIARVVGTIEGSSARGD